MPRARHSAAVSTGSGANSSDWAGIMAWNEAIQHRSVQRAAFRPAGHHPVCQVVSGLQTEFTRLGGDDGRAWHRSVTHNDSAVGAAVRSGIREALEPVRTNRWRLMAL